MIRAQGCNSYRGSCYLCMGFHTNFQLGIKYIHLVRKTLEYEAWVSAFVATFSSLQDLQMKPAEHNKLAATERSSPEDWPLPKINLATTGSLKFTRNFQHINTFFPSCLFSLLSLDVLVKNEGRKWSNWWLI